MLYPNATALVNLLDADAGISLSTNFFGVLKSGTNVVISVTRSNANTGVVSVNFATANGTAVSGQDYYQTNGTLIFSNGIALQSFAIPIINNHVIEGDRSFQVLLSTNLLTLGSPQLLPPVTATVTITDNVSGLSFSGPAYQVSEKGNHAVISVVRTGFTNSSVAVDFATVAGTNSNSAIGGVNYYPTNGTLLFTNGQTFQSFAVPVIDDNRVDGDHFLQLSLSNPVLTNSPVGFAILTTPNSATLTISEADGSEILAAGTALTFTRSFMNTTALSLGTANGASSSILISNLSSQVEKVVLHVPSVTTSLGQDLALMVAGPSGTAVGLAGNAGSAPLSRNSLVFDDGASVALPQNAPITNGTYLPTVYGALPTFGLQPPPIYSTNLSAFADSLPGGAWTLYAADDTAPYSGALEMGWSINLTCLETNANRLIQPGETVTMLVAFRDGAGFGVTNLVATLLPTNGVVNPSAPQSYGPLVPSGPSASRLFTFTANGTNGQVISAQFQLQDGARALNNVMFSFMLGTGRGGLYERRPHHHQRRYRGEPVSLADFSQRCREPDHQGDGNADEPRPHVSVGHQYVARVARRPEIVPDGQDGWQPLDHQRDGHVRRRGREPAAQRPDHEWRLSADLLCGADAALPAHFHSGWPLCDQYDDLHGRQPQRHVVTLCDR